VSSATVSLGDTTYIYLLKGSSTTEFYRYDVAGGTWQTMLAAPTGVSGRAYKNGSTITYDGAGKIYLVKGTYNEFFSYDVNTPAWTTLASVPLTGSAGRKKLKDGAGLAYSNGKVYALKGGNTLEFWVYQADSNRWTETTSIPVGTSGKKVKGGGTLIRGDIFGQPVLWAFKGNNTAEFWQYVPPVTAFGPRPDAGQAMSKGSLDLTGYSLRAVPNPFHGTACVSYSLPRAGNVCLKLYDVSGKLVTTIASGFANAGSYTSHLNARELARGIYVLKLETDSYSATQKLILE